MMAMLMRIETTGLIFLALRCRSFNSIVLASDAKVSRLCLSLPIRTSFFSFPQTALGLYKTCWGLMYTILNSGRQDFIDRAAASEASRVVLFCALLPRLVSSAEIVARANNSFMSLNPPCFMTISPSSGCVPEKTETPDPPPPMRSTFVRHIGAKTFGWTYWKCRSCSYFKIRTPSSVGDGNICTPISPVIVLDMFALLHRMLSALEYSVCSESMLS